LVRDLAKISSFSVHPYLIFLLCTYMYIKEEVKFLLYVEVK